MVIAEYNFKKYYPEEFDKVDYRCEIPFTRNGEELMRAGIHFENGYFYPDLPQGMWDELGKGRLLFQPILNGGVTLTEIRIIEAPLTGASNAASLHTKSPSPAKWFSRKLSKQKRRKPER